jgi:hypothetical protein
MFKALRKRQEIGFRHQCFASAIVAADYRNAHRCEASDKTFSPLDYVVCEEDPQHDPRREEAKRNIASFYIGLAQEQERLSESPGYIMPAPEQAVEQRNRIITNLKTQGFEDAEQMFDEIFNPEGIKR